MNLTVKGSRIGIAVGWQGCGGWGWEQEGSDWGKMERGSEYWEEK